MIDLSKRFGGMWSDGKAWTIYQNTDWQRCQIDNWTHKIIRVLLAWTKYDDFMDMSIDFHRLCTLKSDTCLKLTERTVTEERTYIGEAWLSINDPHRLISPVLSRPFITQTIFHPHFKFSPRDFCLLPAFLPFVPAPSICTSSFNLYQVHTISEGNLIQRLCKGLWSISHTFNQTISPFSIQQ